MRKNVILAIASIALSFYSFAQTNTFPNSGNVGVGTTNPTNLLTAQKNQNGSTLIEVKNNDNGNSARRGIIIGNGTPGNSVYLLSTSSNYNQVNTWSNAGVLGTDSQLSNGLIIRSGSGKIRFQPNGINDKIVFDQDGNVGIGTTNPQEKLKIVNGSVSVDSSSDGSNAFEFGNNYGQMYYDAQSSGEQNRGMYFQEQLSTNRGFHFLNSNGDRLLKINGNGNVGIGTNSPNAKLAVNGNIHTQEVKVDLVGWPDYVFEEDYHLPTLQEVEQHIAEKGHLENIPSAAEVAENGIQLGEMNKKLLEKIEQLTLYMIEQDKKTDMLLKEVQTLKKKNAALEEKLK